MMLIRRQAGPVGQPGMNPPARPPEKARESGLKLRDVLGRDTIQFSGGADDIRNPNLQRWRRILTDAIREDLKQFRSPSNYDKTADGSALKASQDYIDLPRFMRGSNEGGQGQGQGQPGDQVGEVGEDGQPQPGQGTQPGQGKGKPQPGEADGEGEEGEEGEGDKAGQGPGDLKPDSWMPQLSRFEIAQWFDNDLELPNFQPRGQDNIQKIEEIWDNISRQGTPGSLDKRRTFLNAMRREMSEQGQGFDARGIQWRKADHRYQDTSERPIPKENAVCIYILDTSGSMDAKRKKMARDTQFYYSTVIQAKYGQINAEYRGEQATEADFGNGVAEEFIIHDTNAEILVSDEKGTAEHKFYTTTKSGGTSFVPALQKVEELIETKYPLDQWNVYVFHYTDGDTFNDDAQASKILQGLIDRGLNLYGYIQTEGDNRSGGFNKQLAIDYKSSPFVRRVTMSKDSPEECRRAVYSILGKPHVREAMQQG